MLGSPTIAQTRTAGPLGSDRFIMLTIGILAAAGIVAMVGKGVTGQTGENIVSDGGGIRHFDGEVVDVYDVEGVGY